MYIHYIYIIAFIYYTQLYVLTSACVIAAERLDIFASG